MIEIFKELNIDKNYIVGVSGGPDSMFLLDNFVRSGFRKIIVCHVNYKKRLSSDRDELTVKKYCQDKKIKFILLKVTNQIYKYYDQFNSNFQAKARMIRYDFFL